MPYEGDPIQLRANIAQKVWQTARVWITYPSGATAYFDKVRFLVIDNTATVMDSGGNVLVAFDPTSENEVSDKLSTYQDDAGESWKAQNIVGGCGSCGG